MHFRAGADIAISDDTGTSLPPDGISGTFEILETDKVAPDFRGMGRLTYVGERYLQHLGAGDFFIKTGADAPETFLAYRDFDQTSMLSNGSPLKSWQPHVQDWQEGDPVWRDSLGKGIIGAINYLTDKKQNAISFLTMNIDGDGNNVWPFVDSATYDRFDCSKLDQWEIVFSHCDRKGVFLHFKMQEEENDQLLDGGDLGRQRRLYYRELVARFGHHLGLNWNLGEENTNSDAQRKAFARFIADIDPYDHPIVVHTFSGSDDAVYQPLLGDQSNLSGASLQGNWEDIHALTSEWVQKSSTTGRPWIVCNDEQGPAFIGVPNDGFTGSPTQDDIRRSVLWGNLMAGGAGVEYFFGYALPHNDLTCEDFRSRDAMWDFNRIARTFFADYLPFWNMTNADSLVSENAAAYCMTDGDELFAVYLPLGGTSAIDLTHAVGEFEIDWYNPRIGGSLQKGSVINISAGDIRSPGIPPDDIEMDWVMLLRRPEIAGQFASLGCAPYSCDTSVLWWQEMGDIEIDQIRVEKSSDGAPFLALSSQPVVHCVGQCYVKVPLDSTMTTQFRLRVGSGGLYSRVVVCRRTCADQVGSNKNERGEHGKGESGHT